MRESDRTHNNTINSNAKQQLKTEIRKQNERLDTIEIHIHIHIHMYTNI